MSSDGKAKGCSHCDPGSPALKYPLLEDRDFWIVCDVHPLTEGHILIIPKNHWSCMGSLPNNLFQKFEKFYDIVMKFLSSEYGSIAVFEHGIAGQTVFHAHVHFLPFKGTLDEIVEEDYLEPIKSLKELQRIYQNQKKYLFVAINEKMWCVDTRIAVPRFFRDSFAKALDVPERGNWRKTEENPDLIRIFENEINDLRKRWQEREELPEVKNKP